MKFKLPEFLENVTTPIEGEIALRTNYPDVCIVGIDEVGRGPLAGPVVACAAVLKNPTGDSSLNDSKKLTRKKREAMFDTVKEECLCYAIASASAEEIDEFNILEADFLAMRRALKALGFEGIEASDPSLPMEVKGRFPQNVKVLVAVDGNLKIRGVPAEDQIAIVKGDGRIASISAASILAKVFRDRYMDALAVKYPGYAFEKNAGYGTKAHLDGIRKLGTTPEHRKSFHPKSLQTELF
ncbi:MAG: ribonuclease HII [Fibrobacter sp.]|nr:ribonuclease HII [Fibrobacter sp.]